ncbi:DUF6083 domain-containing protein [Streptomyces sp. HYC2]|uniref:DUF6083 domain-containing protein n=1 Tax=Streptomyces sp. HYC2 TaxID=2955207 RepID=UPI002480810B|nr:DUF6083 domain-containing protein [Streptomyces sp. HYC2]
MGDPDPHEAAFALLGGPVGRDGTARQLTGNRPWEKVDRAQAARDGATGPEPPAPPLCPHCGLVGERRPTYTGYHVLLEPRHIVPAHLVPGGHRWHVDTDGTAWNGGLEEPSPGTTCRIPHQLACPSLTPDEIERWWWLASVREENARRARQKADLSGSPGRLPDTG